MDRFRCFRCHRLLRSMAGFRTLADVVFVRFRWQKRVVAFAMPHLPYFGYLFSSSSSLIEPLSPSWAATSWIPLLVAVLE